MSETRNPLVSVVLPTYDRPMFLERAVESVLEQTYRNAELIVVDDCSPTPAREILSEFSSDDVRTTQIRHDENRGANAARNSGIEAASGEFIAFLDDDDRWDPTKLERQVARFEGSPPDIGVVYTGVRIVADSGELNVHLPTPGNKTTEDVLAGRFSATFSTLMIRSSVINEAGLPDERFPSWQDREWCVRLSQHCRFEPVTQPLLIRHHGHGARISEDFEAKRDVSYPLFVSKHRPLAAEYGPACERQLMASLSGSLGWAALRNGYYADARKYLFRSIIERPFSEPERYLRLFASVGGSYTYRPAREASRLLRSLQT